MKTLKYLLFVTILTSISYVSKAQNVLIEGTVKDSISKRTLGSATISLAHAKDSSLISFTRANEDGYFQFKNVAAGKYLISISYVGFQHTWIAIKTGSNPKLSLGDIMLLDNATMSSVTVTAKRAPVVINKDTIEFNSENFKTVPNAVVEDMLKKMPGVDVDKSGAITINGKSVTKVYVNGKEFFTGDPKMATKNLPADAIDKIQVYDRKSDQAMFTGIDDGNEETSINLKLKKDRNQSTFGKLSAGGGTPERWDGQGNMNRLNNDEQMSLIGMANNTNRQGFSFGDISSFNGGGGGMRPGGGGGIQINFGGGGSSGLPTGSSGSNNPGVATTIAGGANYSNAFNNKSTDFNANITGSDIDKNTITNSYTQNLTPNNLFNRSAYSFAHSKNEQEKFGSMIDQKVSETFSFKFTPSITRQNGISSGNSSTKTYLPDGTLVNSDTTITSGTSNAINSNNTLLLRKKFAKKGRTISSTITLGYNESTSNSFQYTDQLTYVNKIITKDSLIDRDSKRTGNSTSYSANVSYTEPVTKKSLLEFNAYLSRSISNSSKKVYDFNNGSHGYDALNTKLTNEYNSDYIYSGGGMNFRGNEKKYTYSVGASLQEATLAGENISVNTKLNQSFSDILPSAMYQYNFSQTNNINFNYRTSTNQPSLTQLQPVLDQSNINSQYIGNPNLRRSYNHNINLRYFDAKILKQRNFFAFLNASFTENSIVNYDSVLPSRAILTRPVNVNGVYSVNGSANYGFKLNAIKSRINFGFNGGYNNNVSYSNGILNTIDIKSIGPSVSYNFVKDDVIDIDLSARYSYSITNNKVNPALNTNYLTRTYNADVTNYLPGHIVLNQSLNYIFNTGRAQGYNTEIPIWNASLSKYFMKNNRGELKLTAFDLLNRSLGVSRTVSQSQIVDQQYNVISRYFLITFTYSLQKSGLSGGGGGRPQMMMRF
jgi:hypothetical protein